MLPAEILVVDDDQDVLSFLQTALTHAGYRTRVASDGQQALSLVRLQKPDVMILDYILPEMNGEELCRVIKQDPQFSDIVVFMLSARSDLQTKLQCFASGADEYLVKPIDPMELAPRINRFLRHSPSHPSQPKSDSSSAAISWPDATFAKTEFGAYRVEGLIGKGGMGQVFKGIDKLLERPVAIKVLAKRLSDSPEFVERFRREARLLASIDHPGIATVYTFGIDGPHHYFAMQWCAGGSLGELIHKKKRIKVSDAVDYILQCAEALNAAAKKGIVHRDIKPSNLMFDEDGRVKLVDFGLAFSERGDTQLTRAAEMLGTPSYMSPEQSRNEKVDHRSDIYSLGITFYHMVYGQTPFPGNSLVDIIIKHATQPFPPYDDLGGTVPVAVYHVMARMTRKDPGDRYQDYEALIADLAAERGDLQTSAALLDSAVVPEKAETPPSGFRIRYGDYVVERVVGEDCVGKVCKVYDEKHGRYAALVLFSSDGPADLPIHDSIQPRHRKLAALNHPGIGTIFDVGRDGKQHYLVQEWCPGGSISNLVRKMGRLSLQSALSLIIQCAQALEAAAGVGILHGSLRPNNILLDEHQRAKIVDLVWSEARRKVRQGKDSGTGFKAPESGTDDIECAADIYSLGMVFTYMLCGIVPFHSLPNQDSMGGLVPNETYLIIRKMTHTSPSGRYRDYVTLIRDLKALASAEMPAEDRDLLPSPGNLETKPLLRKDDFFKILCSAYDQGLTGVLVLRWAVLQTRFLVKQREIVSFESNEPKKSIWHALVRGHLITKEEIPSATDDLEGILRSFLEGGTFSVKDLRNTYRQVMKEAIRGIFIWPVCEAEFFKADITVGSLAAVRLSEVLLEGVRDLIQTSIIQGGVPSDCLVYRTPRFEQLLSSFNLKPDESFIAFRIEGSGTSISALQALTGFPEEKILRLMYLLKEVGAVELRPQQRPMEAKKVSPKYRKEAVQDPRETPATPHVILRQDPRETPATPHVILRQDPPRPSFIPPSPVTPHRPAVSNAQDVPSPPKPGPDPPFVNADPVVRMDVQKSKKEIEAEQNQKTADQFYRLAQFKYKAGDFARAASLCQQAIVYHGDAKYFFLLGLSYSNHSRFQKDAEEAFHQAVRLSPNNPDYHAELASFYVDKKLLIRARTHCEKALELVPAHAVALDIRNFLQKQKLGSGGCWCVKE